MKTNIPNCISIAFQNYGFSNTSIGIYQDSYCFLPLQLHISGKLEKIGKSQNGEINITIKIELNHSELLNEPIYEYVYGWGLNEEEAIINSFERWIESDFPVLHDWIADHKIDSESTTEFKISSYVGATEESIQWNGILGSLVIFKDSKLLLERKDTTKLLTVLINQMTGSLLSNRGIYAIKCFISISSKGEIEIDCRVNGEGWKEGYLALYDYCGKLEMNDFFYMKQYFLIYDLKNETVSEETTLKLKSYLRTNEIPKEKEDEKIHEKWWRFW